jgi:hypothetical protein
MCGKKTVLKQIQNKQQQLIKATKQNENAHKKTRLDQLQSIEPAPAKIDPTTTEFDVEIIVDDI